MTPVSTDEVRDVLHRIQEIGAIAADERKARDSSSDRIQALVAEALATIPMPNGVFDEQIWNQLPPEEQTHRLAALVRFKDAVAVLAEADGPSNPRSIMFREYVSNLWVILMTLFGLFGTLLMLFLIYTNWTRATQPPPADQHTLPVANGPAQVVLPGPLEKDVLLMVMFMGALGGFIHLTGSISKFIGNRKFLRSWVVYYLLMPVEGAGLAVTVYLMVRVGVLNPASSNASATQNLNWVGIYALAALAGLFSKQALELLADIFSTVFRRVQAKDSGATTGPATAPPKTP